MSENDLVLSHSAQSELIRPLAAWRSLGRIRPLFSFNLIDFRFVNKSRARKQKGSNDLEEKVPYQNDLTVLTSLTQIPTGFVLFFLQLVFQRFRPLSLTQFFYISMLVSCFHSRRIFSFLSGFKTLASESDEKKNLHLLVVSCSFSTHSFFSANRVLLQRRHCLI